MNSYVFHEKNLPQVLELYFLDFSKNHLPQAETYFSTSTEMDIHIAQNLAIHKHKIFAY